VPVRIHELHDARAPLLNGGQGVAQVVDGFGQLGVMGNGLGQICFDNVAHCARQRHNRRNRVHDLVTQHFGQVLPGVQFALL
jgi:hypothetical protein